MPIGFTITPYTLVRYQGYEKQIMELNAPLFKTVFLFKPFHPATLFGKRLSRSRIKRMTLGAYFYPYLRFCGASLDDVSARTLHYTFLVFRMYTLLHALHLSYKKHFHFNNSRL